MLNTLSTLIKNIQSLSKIIASLVTFTTLIGLILVVIYSFRIDYRVLKDLSLINDGLGFLMAAICFGLIYLIFLALMLSLGIFMSPAIKGIVHLFILVGSKICKSEFYKSGATKIYKSKLYKLTKQNSHHLHYYPNLKFQFAKFDLFSIPFSLISIYFILILQTHDYILAWILPIFSASLYIIYSHYISYGNEIKQSEESCKSVIYIPVKKHLLSKSQLEYFRKKQITCIGLALVLPLFLGNTFNELLNGAMRLAQIRIERPIIFIKEPYSSTLPISLISNAHKPLGGYKEFEGITVLFDGSGKNTIISFQDSNQTRIVPIPKEYIHVEHKK